MAAKNAKDDSKFEDKQKALDAALSQIEKQFGKGAVMKLGECSNVEEESCAIRDTVIGAMAALRAVADEAETVTAEDYWPFPTYGELLFGVRASIERC